jgi:glutathione S-transferase
MIALILLVLLCVPAAAANAPVYVVLWFDTEDYIEPVADDAALRIAGDLDAVGVRATFKVVGEKARTLEARGRLDVIRALARHDIGYHSNYHSIQPPPALYLRDLGWLEGAAEFEAREGGGAADLRRIFGVTPSCYGQPGSSWGPQADRALLRMGIPVYLDEGENVQLDEQPFWFAGMLHVFGMGRYLIRPELDRESRVDEAMSRLEEAVRQLQSRGGGLISAYYHPTEFVTTEFWDAVNFSKGANPEREQWRHPRLKPREDAERGFRILSQFAERAGKVPGVRFVTARELTQIYADAPSGHIDRAAIAAHLAQRQTFLVTPEGTALSAADMLLILLGIEPGHVEGPAQRLETTYRADSIPRAAFERAQRDVVNFIRVNRRLPSQVWIGSERLSPADFAATLAANYGGSGAVKVAKGNPEMEKYISRDAQRAFRWPIHPEGFSAPGLLELGRLQAWTLKPARLR